MASLRSTPESLEVLYEDNHILAVNKRAGDIVQGDKTGDVPLSEICKQYIAVKYNKPGAVFLGVVHRLDRPTSGLVIFARTSKALSRLNAIFAKREVSKTYWAIVQGSVSTERETLDHFMVRNTKQNKSYANKKEVPNSKKASLTYRVKALLDRYSFCEVNLHTGRHHQIRAQMSVIGHPIKGDLKYGATRSNKDGGIHLHARQVSFIHPVKKEPITITAPTPKDVLWQAAIKADTDRA